MTDRVQQREVTWTWNLQAEGDSIRCMICEGDRPALIIDARDVRWMALALKHHQPPPSSNVEAKNRCGNTIHSNYVTDHRCQLERGHEGDCLFGRAIPNSAAKTVKPEGDKRAVASASVERSAEGVLQASPGEPVTKSPGHQTRNREAELADALYAAYGRGQRDYSKGRVMSFADVLRTYGDPLLQKWRAT